MRVLDEITGLPAYALIRFGDADTVTLLGGTHQDLQRLADVPLEQGPPPAEQPFDRLLLVPFRQICERGFEAHDDGAPLTSIAIEQQRVVPLGELLAELPDGPVDVVDDGGFDVSDAAYADLVRRAVEDEIGQGEGANLVLARSYRARLGGWGTSAALSVFRRLLESQRGAYWTFCVFSGDRHLIGASPERHVSVRGGEVAMNPISGTLRLDGSGAEAQRRQRLLDFLADEKEIFELFMVVDEELKVMCEVCAEGGQVLGPYLKPMSHLVHTEYLLAGHTTLDVREVLRKSMYAATVTGSPVQNACRLIRRYEPSGRGYYGAVLALLGRDGAGAATADAPILIRTADVDSDGNLRVGAGATLVRDSVPEREVQETHTKAAGVLSAFGLAAPTTSPSADIEALGRDESVLATLGSRNQRLSGFWLTDQSATPAERAMDGRRVLLIDGEDDFVHMLAHVLGAFGTQVSIVGHDAYTAGDYAAYDLVVVGPGPGDPRDGGHPKIKALAAATDDLLAAGHPFLAVCLGHQVLCARLGLPLAFKNVVFQGTQQRVHILGREEEVGFYNTFVARVSDEAQLPAGVSVDNDPVSGDVHLITGPHYRGVQFHAESLLTQHGYAILRELVSALLGVAARS
jgi:phenazine biosynthesis protein phzE